MTVRHIAAGYDLTRPLTDTEFACLEALNLIAPCHACTQLLLEGEDCDEVVYHPAAPDDRSMEAVAEEVRAVLSKKKH